MVSLSTQFLRSDLDDVPCPRCGFGLWVRYAEVVAECAVLCPVCRTRIQLRDDRGSVNNAGSAIESEFDQMIKDVFG